jgi:hypothetical protein
MGDLLRLVLLRTEVLYKCRRKDLFTKFLTVMDLLRKLPAELWYEIMKWFDLQDLASLYQVFEHVPSIPALSTITSQVAQALIYDDILTEIPEINFRTAVYLREPRNPITEFGFGEPLLDDPTDSDGIPTVNSQGIPLRVGPCITSRFILIKSLKRGFNRVSKERMRMDLTTDGDLSDFRDIYSMFVDKTLPIFIIPIYVSFFHLDRLRDSQRNILTSRFKLSYEAHVSPPILEDIPFEEPDHWHSMTRVLRHQRLLTEAWYNKTGEKEIPLPLKWFQDIGLGTLKMTMRLKSRHCFRKRLLFALDLKHVEIEFGEMVKPTSSYLLEKLPLYVRD